MVVGWAKGAETPQNRRVVDFWPVSSGHGSYQYVRYGGRQFGAPTWGSVRAATMANAATIVAASRFGHVTMAQRTLRPAMRLDSAAATTIVARWRRPERPPWSMGVTTTEHGHSKRPGTAHDDDLSALRPPLSIWWRVWPHLATCHHSPGRP